MSRRRAVTRWVIALTPLAAFAIAPVASADARPAATRALVPAAGAEFPAVSTAPAAASAAPASPGSSLVQRVLGAAEAQRSVHYDSLTVVGTERLIVSDDAARSVGGQRITLTQGSSTGSVTTVVIGGSAYFNGNAFMLTTYLGFPKKMAQHYAGDWIRVPRADKSYSLVAADVTLASAINSIALKGAVQLLPRSVVAGQHVVGMHVAAGGKAGDGYTMYARATGTPLPVEEKGLSGGVASVIAFSHWNAQVSESVPPRSVPISTVASY